MKMNLRRQNIGAWQIWSTDPYHEDLRRMLARYSPAEGLVGRQDGEDDLKVAKLHAGGRADVYSIHVGGRGYCVKLFHGHQLQDKLRSLAGCSKARRAFHNGLKTSRAGVPTPAVYGFAGKKPFGPDLLVMELIETAVQLNLWIEASRVQSDDLHGGPLFTVMIDALAHFAAEMCNKGVGHKDFSPRNLLIRIKQNQVEFTVIDLEDLYFSADPAKLRSVIEHFHKKMERYLSPRDLNFYLQRFGEEYQRGLTR